MNEPREPQRPEDFHEPQAWEPKYKAGPAAVVSRLLLLLIIAALVILPFTPFAGKIKRGIQQIVAAARESKERVVTKEVPVTKVVPKEVIKEVIKEVPAPPPPLPEKTVPRKETDIATLFNGITIQTDLLTEPGGFASLERLDPNAYKVQFQVSIRVPKPNQSVSELSRINPSIASILPALGSMVESSKVSPFFHKLYDNKTSLVEKDITRLNKILDRHNFFDCETILELTHPETKRKALLIQSEMDVVADGSDGDRMEKLDEYIYLSDFYQPFTSYAWPKKTKKPNPLLAKWETRLANAKAEYAKKGLSAERNRELKAAIDQLGLEIRDLKARSSLIAEKDPFIVSSLLFKPYIGHDAFTPQIGDYGLVIHGDKIYPVICGDYGPSFKMGEASLFVAKKVNDKATPYRRPESDLKVTYLVFPGTADKPFAPPDLDRWHEKCASFLNQIGGLGGAFSLHKWDDPFPKPPPPPPPPPLAQQPAAAAPAAASAAPPAAAAPSAPPPPAAAETTLPALPAASGGAPKPPAP